MILTIYDLSGIQNYVFETNKLKDMIGGSIIIHNALFENIPELFGVENDAWVKNDFTFNDGDEKKIVYIGGGNALVMYDREETEKKYTYELQKRIFSQAGGALKLCTASIIAEEDKSLSENQKKLMGILEQNKREIPNVHTAKGFSINAHDNTNYAPILLFDGKYISTKSKYYKEEIYKDEVSKKKQTGYFKNIAVGDLDYADNFDEFVNANAKNYLAIIHIDGNTMGIKIREFVNKQNDKNLIDGLNAMKTLSAQINEKFASVLKKTISEIYGGKTGKIPFRPIIADGDDITLICRSQDSFKVVKTFIENLQDSKIEIMSDFNLTAGAGIAFVNNGFPFCTAYDMAEQCCKSAKKKAVDLKMKKSSVDFQICYGGMTSNISEFREDNYRFTGEDNKEYRLDKRPYIFNSDIAKYDYYKGFEQLFKHIVDDVLKEKSFGRSKLKGLRNEYGKGVLTAEIYGDFLVARAKAEEKAKPKSYEIALELKEPFDEDNEAKYFDILDVMDLIREVKADE